MKMRDEGRRNVRNSMAGCEKILRRGRDLFILIDEMQLS